MYPVPCKRREVRPSTVDALERNPSGRRTIIRNHITSGSIHTTQGGATVARPLDVPAKPKTKRSSKGRIKSSTVAIYTGLFALLIAVIAVGYRTPQEASVTASATPVVATTDEDEVAVNDVVATDIAASVAEATELAVAPNIAERAVSTRIQSEYATTADTATIAKPVIVEPTDATRSITTYTIEPGDTVDSVAAKFGITAQTIKWANDLTTDSLVVGNTLEILPRDGIVYTVADGDTIESIADKYKADASLVTTYNDLEINGVSTGLKIIIPNGELPETERPGYIAPVVYSYTSTGSVSSYSGWRAASVGNRYAFGNCTWYAYERRAAIGRPVGSFWGNGGSWAYSAMASGFTVNNTPAAGAVFVEAGSPGHAGVVESVNADGSIVVSEMNNAAYGGFNIVNNRTISAGQAAVYRYVH